MGKGYNNYMCKKPFHPGSKANIKRAWMAEQKTENDVRKQEELKLQYEKEQDLYNNRTLLNKESKDKLCLNFMYEAPPGVKKEHEKEEDEPEFKFEWQRKYNAPREDYARGNAEIRDQPFGIQVRNVRCIKCHKWGHINTDKECPMYNKGAGSGEGSAGMDPMELMRRMKEEEGLALKQSILGHHVNPNVANQQLLESEEEDADDAEMQFLKSLSVKQKEKLLRRLERLDKKAKNGKTTHKKKKKTKKTTKSKKRDSSDSESDRKTKKKSKKSKTKKKKRKSSKKVSSSSASSSESSDDESLSDSNEEKPRKSRKDISREAIGNGKRQRHDTSDSDEEDSRVRTSNNDKRISTTDRSGKDLRERNSRSHPRERARSRDRNRNKRRRSSSTD